MAHTYMIVSPGNPKTPDPVFIDTAQRNELQFIPCYSSMKD